MMIAFDLARFLREKRRTEQEWKSCEKERDRYRYRYIPFLLDGECERRGLTREGNRRKEIFSRQKWISFSLRGRKELSVQVNWMAPKIKSEKVSIESFFPSPLSTCNHDPLSSQLHHHQDILQKKMRTKEDDGMCVQKLLWSCNRRTTHTEGNHDWCKE